MNQNSRRYPTQQKINIAPWRTWRYTKLLYRRASWHKCIITLADKAAVAQARVSKEKLATHVKRKNAQRNVSTFSLFFTRMTSIIILPNISIWRLWYFKLQDPKIIQKPRCMILRLHEPTRLHFPANLKGKGGATPLNCSRWSKQQFYYNKSELWILTCFIFDLARPDMFTTQTFVCIQKLHPFVMQQLCNILGPKPLASIHSRYFISSFLIFIFFEIRYREDVLLYVCSMWVEEIRCFAHVCEHFPFHSSAIDLERTGWNYNILFGIQWCNSMRNMSLTIQGPITAVPFFQ